MWLSQPPRFFDLNKAGMGMKDVGRQRSLLFGTCMTDVADRVDRNW